MTIELQPGVSIELFTSEKLLNNSISNYVRACSICVSVGNPSWTRFQLYAGEIGSIPLDIKNTYDVSDAIADVSKIYKWCNIYKMN